MQCATLLINTSKAIFLVLKWQISNANLFTTEILGIFFVQKKWPRSSYNTVTSKRSTMNWKLRKIANFTELLLITTNKYLSINFLKNFCNVVHCEVRLTVEVTLFFDLSSLVNVHSRGQKIVFSHEIDIIAECKTQVKNTKIFEKLGLMAEQWCWPSRPPWHGLATILSLHAFLKLLSWWCGRPRICKNHWGHKKVCQHTVSAAATRQN